MSFQTINEVKYEEAFEQESFLQGSEDDVDYNHNLKTISQIYLKENGFDLGDEPEVEDMSSRDFIKIIEEKSENNSEMIKQFEDYNLEINFRSLQSNFNIKVQKSLVISFPTFFLFLSVGRKKTKILLPLFPYKYLTLKI